MSDTHLTVVQVWCRCVAAGRHPGPDPHARPERQTRGVFGALNVRTGEWFYQLAAHKRSADFLAFLMQLWVAYPTGRVYVLVDNASIHTSQMVQHGLATHDRLVLLYLPTYSGHTCTCNCGSCKCRCRLNPVEKVWWALKGNTRTRPARLSPAAPGAGDGASVAANRAFRNLAELDAAIHGYFADFPPARVLALINCELVRQAQLVASQTA